MSEIVLTNSYDYNMMVDMDPRVKANDTNNSSLEDYSSYQAYTPFPGYPPYNNMPRMGYYSTHQETSKIQPNSPESSSSSTSPSPSFSTEEKLTSSATARVKEMITRANSVPMEFYHTEFLEYSKETYEKKMESKRNKRKRTLDSCHQQNKKKKAQDEEEEEEEDDDDNDNDEENKIATTTITPSSTEMRRQIHIQSEQKRRAQIKDGFDELKKHLPGCHNKKMSKAALLTRTVQQLQHLKGMQNELLSEIERLGQENETLKKFQHGILQRQAMEKMYTF
ncbi:hypothetical protein BY458DRAFT_518946 [Sporodiniella umbellata]|nr:hypothetical protein BY458DRAFT_518946 [Sporodiniella umbellata]